MHSARPSFRISPDAQDWEQGPERRAYVEKMRTMPPPTKVIIAGGAKGRVVSTNEKTLTVVVDMGFNMKRAMPYHVKSVEKDPNP